MTRTSENRQPFPDGREGLRQADLRSLVRSVRNDFPGSLRPPGSRWRARRQPPRLCARTQHPLAPRPSGVHFRCVVFSSRWGLSPYTGPGLGKSLAACWAGVGWLPPPRVPARAGRASGACCPAQGVEGSLSRPPQPAPHLWDPGVAAPRRIGPNGARPPTPRVPFLGFLRCERRGVRRVLRPARASLCAPISRSKQQRVCAPRSRHREDPPRRVWAPLGSPAPVRSRREGSGAGPSGPDPPPHDPAHPGSQRPEGSLGLARRGAPGRDDGGGYLPEGSQRP